MSPGSAGWSAWLRIRSGGRPRWQVWREPYTPERVGLLAMLCVVVVFGAHSLVDWTWYIPGDACVALLCAGWLAGRGPLIVPGRNGAGTIAPARDPRALLGALRRGEWADIGPVRLAVAGAVIVAALLAAWSQLQPQRGVEAGQAALAAARAHDQPAALAAAHTAVSRDPLSAEALFTLSEVELLGGQTAQARASLQRAVRLQPSNPQTWLELARFDLHREPSVALRELQAAIYLDPELTAPEALAADREAIEVHNEYLEALRATAATAAARSASARRSQAARRGRHAPPPARSGSRAAAG